MKRILIALALSSLLVPVSANLIVNGGFEDGKAYNQQPIGPLMGIPAPWGGNYMYTFDKTGTDGYDSNGMPDYYGGFIFQGMPAVFGNRFAMIPRFNFEGYVSQAISGLTVGEEYTLSGWMQTDATGNGNLNINWPFIGYGTVDVFFGSTLIGTFNPNSASGVWEQRSFNFLAPAASGVLGFFARFDPNGNSTPYGDSTAIGLDELSLTPVPEPATMVALGTGLVALARRRRKA